MFKKLLIGAIVLVIIAGGAYLTLGGGGGAKVKADDGTPKAGTPLPSVKTGGTIVADAKVVPLQSADLSLPFSGIVTKILVAEGERVEAGQLLLQLNASKLNESVVQAEAKLSSAQSHLGEVTAGSRPQEIAAAEATLAVAKANLEKVQLGPDDDKIVTARVDLANAEAAIRQAQTAYDMISWRSDIQTAPEALQLQKATNDYTGAKGRLENLLKGLKAADVAAAQAEVQRAQAQLDLVKAGARPESVTAARAEVDAAKSVLDQAKAALNEAQLRAPFAGTVVSIDVKLGEQVAPTSVAVRLADVSAWQIETQDLTELGVVRLHKGDSVAISFDAIPDLQLTGKVSRINEFGKNRQGDIVYTVYVTPDKHEERLRWNMTASVTITP